MVSRQAAGPQAPVGGAGAAAGGLVPFQTSDTRSADASSTSRCFGDLVEVERGRARLNRLYRSTVTSARLACEIGTHGGVRGRWVMVTLTLAPGNEWQPRMLSRFLKHVRQWLQRRRCTARGVWVAELQKRGVVHYHLCVWLPRHLRIPKPDKRGWWPYGSSRVETARSPIRYLAAYAGKEGQKDPTAFPKGARLYGAFGLDLASRVARRWWLSPAWLREITGDICDVARSVGGGWLRRDSGEWWPSPWRLFGVGGGVARLVWVGWPS